jgi:Ca-activated chloride channel family protein
MEYERVAPEVGTAAGATDDSPARPNMPEADYAGEYGVSEAPAKTSEESRPREEPMPQVEAPGPNSEAYENYGVNQFVDPNTDRLSTFAIDVDTASYTIARRKLSEGQLPPQAAVRVEEFVNFFDYDYPQPDGGAPFGVNFEAAPSPFDRDRLFLRIGVQGMEVARDARPPAHLTFLVDTSGSMQSEDKMGLLKQSLRVLVDNLQPGDTVAIATYAGWVSEVLPSTDVRHLEQIHGAINMLSAQGSTAMASGIELAYKLAYQNLKPGHVNRVIVCSDGDANVGPASHQEILHQIKHYTQEGVTLSTIGFGMGNYKDVMMEQLANQGNGNYYYIDSPKQAQKVFGDDLTGTLMVIAKDVKIQVEFDPRVVRGYRLVGYENRDIADKDFRDDAVDAGEIGAGHNVTAVYEVVLRDGAAGNPAVVRLRAKHPDGARAEETTYPFSREQIVPTFDRSSRAFRLAVSVAAFAEILRGSPFAADWRLEDVRDLAKNAVDSSEPQQELIALIERAMALRSAKSRFDPSTTNAAALAEK